MIRLPRSTAFAWAVLIGLTLAGLIALALEDFLS